MNEWTIDELHGAYRSRETDPVQVCNGYLERIAQVDSREPTINSIIEVNPDAIEIARERAASIRERGISGLLDGVPVVLKDNIDTGDRMQTTAGSLALVGETVPHDAFLVERLRAEGAIILAKTNLSEWANFRGRRSNSGWSSRGGQTRNPYAPDRTPCGSSSGTGAAIAANLAVVGVGTETDGSVTCPAAHNSLVGLKPTLGAVSRSGIIPIAASQDTAGPMTRTVRDAAILLQAMAGLDAEDPASFAPVDFLTHLDSDYLRGRRIGVARALAEGHRAMAPLFIAAIEALRRAGAVLVDPVEMPDLTEASKAETTVLLYEFKHGLASYFARRGTSVRSIDDLIAFNSEHADEVLTFFGQEHMIDAAACGSLSDEAYVKARADSLRLAGEDGLFAILREHNLDAVVAPSNGPAWLIDHVNGDYYTGGSMSTGPAITGAPHITVPMGYHAGLPMGLSIAGLPGTDASILGIAYAFEAITKARKAPPLA